MPFLKEFMNIYKNLIKIDMKRLLILLICCMFCGSCNSSSDDSISDVEKLVRTAIEKDQRFSNLQVDMDNVKNELVDFKKKLDDDRSDPSTIEIVLIVLFILLFVLTVLSLRISLNFRKKYKVLKDDIYYLSQNKSRPTTYSNQDLEDKIRFLMAELNSLKERINSRPIFDSRPPIPNFYQQNTTSKNSTLPKPEEKQFDFRSPSSEVTSINAKQNVQPFASSVNTCACEKNIPLPRTNNVIKRIAYFGNVKGNFFNNEYDYLKDEAKFKVEIEGDKGQFTIIDLNRIRSTDNIRSAVKFQGEILSEAISFETREKGTVHKEGDFWIIDELAVILLKK